MGIHNLTKLLHSHAPACTHKRRIEDYFGRRVAIDASMHLYQFMVVVGRVGDHGLKDMEGNDTSHLQGVFYRTIRMLEAGIKPVYVFDGKAPELKSDELEKRMERRVEAEKALEAAKEQGDEEAIAKFSKRTVRVTKQHNEECQKLLELLGVPIVQAPSEAEAQCAQLCKDEVVYAVATEDMDALTFGSPRLVRNLMGSNSKDKEVTEFDYEVMLSELGLSEDAFVDLCILAGCDYCSTIKGVGGVTALKWMRQHGSIDKALEAAKEAGKELRTDDFHYQQARDLFKNPEVLSKEALPEIKWRKINVEGLVEFLVGEKGFSEDRVRRGSERATAARGKSAQTRLDSFFTPTPKRKVDQSPPPENKSAPQSGKIKRRRLPKKKSE